jgi:hypothetical protein
MNITRQRSNTPTTADRALWPNRDDLAARQCRREGETASRADSPPDTDGIEAWFHHALGALDPDELADLFHGH